MAFDNTITALKEVVWNSGTEETPCESAEQEADHEIDRRNVLKGLSAGSGAAVLGASPVAADEGGTVPKKRPISEKKRDEILGPYTEVGKMREGLIANVAPLLRELSKTGYTDTANPARLGLDELQEFTSESPEGITAGVVTKQEIEDPSRLINAVIEHKSRRLEFWVNPDGEVATSLVYAGNGKFIKEIRVHNSSAGSSPVIEDEESPDCDDSTQTHYYGADGSASTMASEGPTGCAQPGSSNWYCGTWNDCEDNSVGYCDWSCACGWAGGCSGSYTLHHIKEVYDDDQGVWKDAVIACPDGAYCTTTGCKNLNCKQDCLCNAQCTNDECPLC